MIISRADSRSITDTDREEVFGQLGLSRSDLITAGSEAEVYHLRDDRV